MKRFMPETSSHRRTTGSRIQSVPAGKFLVPVGVPLPQRAPRHLADSISLGCLQDERHLADARAALQMLYENAPPKLRTSMLTGVRLHRAIMAGDQAV